MKLKKITLITSALALLVFHLNACDLPHPIGIYEKGELVAHGSIKQVIYPEDGYQLCFDLGFNKKLDVRTESRSVIFQKSSSVTLCRPFMTNDDGTYRIAFEYNFFVEQDSSLQDLKVKEISPYLINLNNMNANAKKFIEEVESNGTYYKYLLFSGPKLNVTITDYEQSANVYNVGLQLELNKQRNKKSDESTSKTKLSNQNYNNNINNNSTNIIITR